MEPAVTEQPRAATSPVPPLRSARTRAPAPPSPPAAANARPPRLARIPGLTTAATFLTVLLVWEGAVRALAIPSFLLPAPSAIIGSFGAVGPARWATHIWATLRVAVMGFSLAILVAIPLAMVMMRSAFLSRTLYPLLIVVQSTPVVAIAPIIVVALGAGDLPRVVITTLIAFFPLVVSTATGLAATPPS
nr:ABC transporter permease subunit [Paracoccus aestuarii]